MTEVRYGASGWSKEAVAALRQVAAEGLVTAKISDRVIAVEADSFPKFFGRMAKILDKPVVTPEPRAEAPKRRQ